MRAKTLALVTAVLLAAGALRAAVNTTTQTTTGDPFVAAKNLSKAGLDADALDEVKKTLKAPPQKTIPKELEYLTGSKVVRFVMRYQFTVITLAIFLVIATVLILRRVLEPRLQISDMKDVTAVSGHNAAFFLQQNLIALTRQRTSSFQFVTGPITQINVPAAVTSAIPTTFDWVKGLLSVLTMISYRRLLVLDGVLQPATDRRGVGITLMLARGKEVVSTTTLWEEDFAPVKPAVSTAGGFAAQNPTPYFYLSESASIWLLFQLFQLKHTKDGIRRLIGTDNWRSYALNAAGLRAEKADENARAQELFVLSIRYDPLYSAPRANLASLLQNSGEYERALDQFGIAIREVEQEGAMDDPVYYWSAYNVALIHYNTGKAEKALQELEALIGVMEKTKNSELRSDTDRERFLDYLGFALPVIDTMRVGVAVALKKMTVRDAYQQVLQHQHFPTADLQFTLASTYALMARAAPEDADRIVYNRAGIDRLRFALQLEPKRCADVERDQELLLLRVAHMKDFDNIVARAKERVEKKAPVPIPAATATVMADPKGTA